MINLRQAKKKGIYKITAVTQKHASEQKLRSKVQELYFKVAGHWMTIFFSALGRWLRNPAHCSSQHVLQVTKREREFKGYELGDHPRNRIADNNPS